MTAGSASNIEQDHSCISIPVFLLVETSWLLFQPPWVTVFLILFQSFSSTGWVNTYSRIFVNLRKLSTLQFNNKMNIYTFKILMKHSMIIEEKNDPENKFWTCFHISEVGPPNRPDLNKIRMIKHFHLSRGMRPKSNKFSRKLSFICQKSPDIKVFSY